jgi:hypothetical protein
VRVPAITNSHLLCGNQSSLIILIANRSSFPYGA